MCSRENCAVKSDMDVLFLGGLFPKETEKDIINNSKVSIQNAANVLQWHLVNGLDSHLYRKMKIINSVYIGAYPKRYKKCMIPTYGFKHAEGSDDINVGFLNLPLVKHLSRYWSLCPHVKTWINQKKGNRAVIAYALTSINVKLMRYIKRINPTIQTCIVVPDLPQYMFTGKRRSFLHSLLKERDIKKIKRLLHYVDHFVLLTKQMNEFIGSKSFCVVEGIAGETKLLKRSDDARKTILYSGTLNEKYGILNLLKAFRMIDNPNYQLIICGSGDSEEAVVSACREDKRINYLGLVPRDKVLELQSQATITVNPRQNTEEFTKYSFPSKNMEFLASGVPFVAYKLDGIPDEYDPYIFYVKDNSVCSLKEKMVEVCEMPAEERLYFADNARNFVLTQKNEVKQTKKILEMLESR